MKVTDYAPRAGYFDTLLRPEHKIVVEVGVSAGAHAHGLLQFNPCIEKLYLVDPWEEDSGYVEGYCHGRLLSAGFKNRVCFWQLSSMDAALGFATNNKKVDAVYFDQLHETELVRLDLRTWWQLLNSGGIIGYRNYPDPPVGAGVDKWLKESGLSSDYIHFDSYSGEMIINKP